MLPLTGQEGVHLDHGGPRGTPSAHCNLGACVSAVVPCPSRLRPVGRTNRRAVPWRGWAREEEKGPGLRARQPCQHSQAMVSGRSLPLCARGCGEDETNSSVCGARAAWRAPGSHSASNALYLGLMGPQWSPAARLSMSEAEACVPFRKLPAPLLPPGGPLPSSPCLLARRVGWVLFWWLLPWGKFGVTLRPSWSSNSQKVGVCGHRVMNPDGP